MTKRKTTTTGLAKTSGQAGKPSAALPIGYALRDLKKPIGVAQWQTKLVESLPKNLKGSLPTVAEIEAELDNARIK
jgi:hypothetical protein